MRRRPKTFLQKFSKGHEDHIDAWLISYADMITLLFIVVVIAIPVAMNKENTNTEAPRGEPEHPYHIADHTGLLAVNTIYDEAYRSLVGIIIKNNADEDIAVEKTETSMWLDISVPFIFEEGSAFIRDEQAETVKSLIRSVKKTIPAESTIEVEGYTDDTPLVESKYANNWELSSMQTARIAGLLIDSGIDANRLRITSYAGNSPIVPNLDEFGRPIDKNRIRNRRIVVKISVPAPAKNPRSL
ncbi:MAG: OmpA family protein [Rickettsiales bacterium]